MTRMNLPEPGILLSGRYLLEEVIGSGATAYVYRATDQLLGQTIAIKVISLEDISKEIGVDLEMTLRQEAIASMRLSHPSILRVYNYERHDPWEFLVMELIDGKHLGRVVRSREDRRIPPRQLVQIALDSLDALAYAHKLGVVHNDLKPGNIMITRQGGTKLCDFGLAQMSAQKTSQGSIIAGTPPFMSPERIRGEEGTPVSDLYSLAAMLYALGHGEPPFGRDTNEALRGHLRRPFPSTSKLPKALHQIFAHAMEKQPSARFSSAEEMAAAMRPLYEILQRDHPEPSYTSPFPLIEFQEQPSGGAPRLRPITPGSGVDIDASQSGSFDGSLSGRRRTISLPPPETPTPGLPIEGTPAHGFPVVVIGGNTRRTVAIQAPEERGASARQTQGFAILTPEEMVRQEARRSGALPKVPGPGAHAGHQPPPSNYRPTGGFPLVPPRAEGGGPSERALLMPDPSPFEHGAPQARHQPTEPRRGISISPLGMRETPVPRRAGPRVSGPLPPVAPSPRSEP
ncbi:protein kinase, partial [Myxococcota bacterium]|nr:protein kinase [Myxococcota bacterium]